MVTLGLDPGYGRLGWGAVETKGSAISSLGWGVIETSKEAPFEDRLLEVARGLESLVRRFKPSEAALETLYFSKNAKTALKVAEARGALRLKLREMEVPVLECQPQEVKMALAGAGQAPKAAVARMVMRLLSTKEIPKPDDAADALALALTAIRSAGLRKLQARIKAR